MASDTRSRLYGGYYRSTRPAEDAELTHVGPGTPCGEYMRRFWHPVALSSQLGELPYPLRILSEDLVAFRDLSGRVGLLHRACCHRGTSLEYGIIAENGLRCCYHGWLFDIDGRILETPGEPATSRIREIRAQGAYPARELHGLVFAYLGPPDDIPEFPIYDTFDLPDTELEPYLIDYPCNWLQVAENPMDPFHSVFLHTRATRAHFNPSWGAMPIVEWHALPDGSGIWLTNARFWEGRLWVRTAETILPNFAQPPDIYQDPTREKLFPRVGISKWTVPVDDTHCRIIAWRHFGPELDEGRKGDRSRVGFNKVDFIGQTGIERSPEEARRVPGDYEAQVSQGPIAVHAAETLGRTDAGVALLRRLLRRGIRAVARGEATPRPDAATIRPLPTMAGDVIIDLPEAEGSEERQRGVAAAIGQAIFATRDLPHTTRRAEIGRRTRAIVAEYRTRWADGARTGEAATAAPA